MMVKVSVRGSVNHPYYLSITLATIFLHYFFSTSFLLYNNTPSPKSRTCCGDNFLSLVLMFVPVCDFAIHRESTQNPA